MRARYKCPNGTGVVEMDDTATVEMLFGELRTKTSLERFTIKYGPPASMKTVTTDQGRSTAISLGLHGETLTIVPSPAPVKSDLEGSPTDCVIPWPERNGSLLLRVMPSDNNCLFTSFGGALSTYVPPHELRLMIVEYIAEHPELYGEAVLGCPPAEYQRNIIKPDRWGGGIELAILATIFDVQICTFDVQGQFLVTFGEEKRNRCILVYSGIHYDRVVFSPSEPPHDMVSLPEEADRTTWPTADMEVLEKTKLLVRKLNAGHYYTDTQGLVLRCEQAGCGWIGSGQMAANRHGELTGHTNLTEIPDTEENNILRSCSTRGCNFMGQGGRAIAQHKDDTGHHKFDIIPDL